MSMSSKAREDEFVQLLSKEFPEIRWKFTYLSAKLAIRGTATVNNYKILFTDFYDRMCCFEAQIILPPGSVPKNQTAIQITSFFPDLVIEQARCFFDYMNSIAIKARESK